MADKKKTLELGNVADILAFDDSKDKLLEVPEWNCSVKIKALTKADQFKARKAATTRGQLDEVKLEGLMLITGIVEPKFSPEHLDGLMKKQASVIDRILTEIMELSGVIVDDEDEAAEEESF